MTSWTSKAEIVIDLKKDLKEFLKHKFSEENLTQMGVYPSKTELIRIQDETLENLIFLYSKLRNRLLIGRKRKVILHNSLLKNFKYREYKNVIVKLKRIFENGSNIRPYLSRQVNKIYFDDRLLLDWNVHHVHFVSCDSKAKRTKDLLFITEVDNVVHFLTIMTHNDFENLDLLRYIHDNCPSVLEAYRLTGFKTLLKNYSSEEIKNLRNCDIGYCVSFDNDVYAPSLNKRSVTSLKKATVALSTMLNQVEESILQQKEDILKQLPCRTKIVCLEWLIEKGKYKLQLYDKTLKVMFQFNCLNLPNPIKILEDLNII